MKMNALKGEGGEQKYFNLNLKTKQTFFFFFSAGSSPILSLFFIVFVQHELITTSTTLLINVMAFSKTQGKKQEAGTGPHLKQQRLEMTFFKKKMY